MSSCFQVPVCGGSRHAETWRPGGKREHPATAGSGLSSHVPNTHTDTLTDFHRTRNPQSTTHTNTRTHFAREQVLHVSWPSNNCHQPSVCVANGEQKLRNFYWRRSLSIYKEFVLFFFWLMTLKYWKLWDCILCLKKPGCVSSFPEDSSRDAQFYRSEG